MRTHAYLIRIVVLLQCLELAAQETPAPTASPEASRALTVAEVESRLKEIETREIETELKDELKKPYVLAQSLLETAAGLRAKAAEFEKQLQADPQDTEILRREISETAKSPVAPTAIDSTAPLKTLEQSLESASRQRDEMQKARSKLDADIEILRGRPAQARVELEAAKSKLAEVAEETRKLGSKPAPADQLEAQRIVLEARRLRRSAEINALQKELAANSGRIELLNAQREKLALELPGLEAHVTQLRQVVGRLRLAEVERERKAAVAAQEADRDKHPSIQALTAERAQVSMTSKAVSRELQQANQLETRVKKLKAEIERDSKAAAQRLAVGSGELGGESLRRRRLELPRLADFREIWEERQAKLARAELAYLDVKDRIESLSDVEARVNESMATVVQGTPTQERAGIEAAIRERIALLRESLDGLRSVYVEYVAALVRIGSEERGLVSASEEFGEYLDEHLLWIPSTSPFGLQAAKDTAVAAVWLCSPSRWVATARGQWMAIIRRPVLFCTFVLFIGAVVAASVRLGGRRKEIETRVGRVQSDGFLLTVEWLLLDLAAIMAAPAALGFLGWLLQHRQGGDGFQQAVGQGLSGVALVVGALLFLHRVVSSPGAAENHFRWSPHALATFRRKSLWSVAHAMLLPATFVVTMVSAYPDSAHQNSLGRVAFLVLMAAIFYLFARVLHPSTGAPADSLRRHPDGWASRTRWLWYLFALSLPVTFIALTVSGYYYTALELGGDRFIRTILIFGAAALLHNLLLRWLQVAHRRLAWEKAKEERAARLAAMAAAAGPGVVGDAPKPESDVTAVEEPLIDLDQIQNQARHLIGTFMGAGVLVGLWLVWAPVLPAFSVFDKVVLWSYTETTLEGDLLAYVTLKNMLGAVVILLITAIAGRNIPGALELTVLQKLPFEPGGRYAVSTICQYLIVLVGVVLMFGAIGVGWSQVQWLLAAVSLGLGFGLQEIFANFVSGIILLFERPIRVGDVVTIGDVSGVVTRIRMRATTIRNWERKELIVPNKEFITGRLLNWTLSDSLNRVLIEVGVAYGSDTNRARELLLKVAQDHPLVLEEPEPMATFEAFGESTLNLVLRCFLPDLDNRLASITELYTAIDAAFKEASIEIAFPQRDLHLRSADAPLAVPEKPERRWG